MQNVILSDCNLSPDFLESLKQNSKLNWDVLVCDNRDNNIKRIFGYFVFPLRIFLTRKNISNIICWQQFYGILFAFYCKLFGVNKHFKLIVMTFIYKEKKGILGKIYFKFMNYALSGNYIDKAIVFSKKEVDYYSNIFNNKTEYVYIPLGIDQIQDINVCIKLVEEKYILSVGRSNRDYDFLIENLSNTRYNVKIIADNISYNNKYSNIQIFKNIFGKEMFYYMKNCYCVALSFSNTKVSAGQLVVLQAMQLGKPVIVTKSDGIRDYIKDGVDGFIIEKSKNALLQCLDILYSDENLYLSLCDNARNNYEQNFSVQKLGENIAKVFSGEADE